MIIYVQCHAIRDAQILEKEEIKRDIHEEENRLDVIREVHQLNAIKDAEDNRLTWNTQLKSENRLSSANRVEFKQGKTFSKKQKRRSLTRLNTEINFEK